jgi:hypothetical protein
MEPVELTPDELHVLRRSRTHSLLASAYVMIRGMDNFKKDLDERKKKTRPETAEA